MKFATTVAALSILALGAGVAQAADLPTKAPSLYSPEPISQWGGFYVGVSGGYGFGTTRHTATAGLLSATSGDFDANGGLLGGTFGYNRQVGSWIWGFETDISKSWIKGDANVAILGTTTLGTRLDWLSTVRGRIGRDMGYWGMGYVTGGAAIGNIKARSTSTIPFPVNTEISDTSLGWTVGVGWERKITQNVSAKIEYLYADFGTTNIAGDNVKLSTNIVRAGLNYKLGDLVH